MEPVAITLQSIGSSKEIIFEIALIVSGSDEPLEFS
jgi:hypothetical protein